MDLSIKNIVKKRLNSGFRIDVDELYEKIKRYDYVSFDIFDTLVKRNVEEPADIFRIMEKKVGGDFKNKRIEAEKKARIDSCKKEILIEDIYSYFPENKRDEYIRFELDTEFKAIVPNKDMVDLYKKCLADGKTVFITSDMYWPENVVRKLLEKNGIIGFKSLYLSSSELKVKSDGSLFGFLCQHENLKPEEIIHLGDSKKGDYEEPQRLGIKAIRIPRYIKNIEFRGDDRNDSIELNYLNNFINNTVPNFEDPYYLFGYSQFGKLLYGYVHWIHDQVVKREIKKIFFLARDGYIMKQAYEACVDDDTIEVNYMEVSRRSLRGPILWMDCSYETILNMVVNAKLVSLESIFDGLGLEIDKYITEIAEYGLKRDCVFDRKNIESNVCLRKLIEMLMPDIIENSKEEYKLLKAYLEKNKVQGRFCVVDIGYGGSMQRYLQQVLTKLGIKHDISGFYLGVADFFTKNMLPGVKLDLNGYLFDFQHDKDAVDTRSSFVGLFETLFLEQSGSVKKYVAIGEEVYAERYPYEYEINGKPTDDLMKVKKIQEGAIDFVKAASKDELLQILRCGPEEYFYGIYKTGTDPNMKDLKLLGDIHFYDEGIKRKLAAPNSIAYYFINPRQMKNDFLQCRWKTGFLKRMIKVNFPYQKIYQILRNMG